MRCFKLNNILSTGALYHHSKKIMVLRRIVVVRKPKTNDRNHRA